MSGVDNSSHQNNNSLLSATSIDSCNEKSFSVNNSRLDDKYDSYRFLVTINSHHKLIHNKPTVATTSTYCANCAPTDAMNGDRGGGGDERQSSAVTPIHVFTTRNATRIAANHWTSGDDGTHVRLNTSKIGGQPLAISNGHKKATTGTAPTNGANERLNGGSVGDNLYRHSCDNRFESSIHAIRDMMSGTTHAMPKSRSLDAINHKSWTAGAHYKPSNHFHLQYKDIPSLLGTTLNSHSVITNRQLEISGLKQHNQLCSHRNHNIPVRKIFDSRCWTQRSKNCSLICTKNTTISANKCHHAMSSQCKPNTSHTRLKSTETERTDVFSGQFVAYKQGLQDARQSI
ncbi:unnamed protein product [Oppiella nova]|uniref:Uncharacterized protein n=1 Tax=Oppiella nova TaxID=334625 RepID=A0A7R9QD94_9ACAR|nr:unnamed protein product [Oppiella nova]CAG2163498.1 unnamed protein product [Oppiella nova]